MKKTSLASLLFIMVLVSCEKKDLEQTAPLQESEVIASSKTFTGWASVNNWISSTPSSYKASISDSAITDEIVAEGLVLLFTKHNDMPSLAWGSIDKSDWLYQVEAGTIQINASIAKGATFDVHQPFSYFIIPKSQLSKLNEKGIDKSKLFDLSYNEIMQLLNQSML